MNKIEIIEQIEQLKRNKYKFDNLNEYYNKINLLYHQLSKTINKQNESIKQVKDDEKIEKIKNDIMNNGSYSYLIENPKIKLLSKKYPLFDLFLIENNLMIHDLQTNYTIQIEPIINNYDIIEMISNIKFLLSVCKIVIGKTNKIIMILIMFDLLFKNFNFFLSYDKFKIITMKKLKEFEKEKDILDIISNKYKLETDIINKWLNVLNNNIKN